MSFAIHARNRNAERLTALVSAVALLMSLMAIYAAPAKAHHPTTTASVVCVGPDVAIQYTSTSWQNGSSHNDIRIQISVNGGNWTQVASGAYNQANGYTFSGTIPADSYVGDSVRVRSWAQGTWTNGAAAGNGHRDATTGSFTVVDACDPGDQPVNVTVSGGVCEVVQGSAAGSATITINPASGATVNVYSDAGLTSLVDTRTSSGTVTGLAPGTYYWTATAADGYELTGSGSGQFTIEDCTPPPPPAGWACVDEEVVFIEDATDFEGTLYETEQDAMNDPDCTPPPPPPSGWVCQNGDVSFMEDATGYEGTLYDTEEEAANDPDCAEVAASIVVSVTSSCTVNDGVGQGEINVIVSVDGGATVTITDESGAVVGTFTSDGTLAVPEGATYTWVAVPSDGFEFPEGFAATGTVTIETCTPTTPPPDEVMAAIRVTVSGSCELDGDEGEGFIDVTLSVANGATVVVRDADGDVVGTVTDDATLSVPEGATYTWSATPSEGFEFPAGFASSGSVTIERCSDPETLPFTGFDPMGMGLFAILLVGAGITAIYRAPREEGA